MAENPKPYWHIRHTFTTDKNGRVIAEVFKAGDHEFEWTVFRNGGKVSGKTRHFEDAVCEANALLEAKDE